jgi:ABC-type transport system substrate-binding protein
LFYGCGSSLDWSGYCNPEVEKLIERQSREADPDWRNQMLKEIERKLAGDDARPIFFYPDKGQAAAAACSQAKRCSAVAPRYLRNSPTLSLVTRSSPV